MNYDDLVAYLPNSHDPGGSPSGAPGVGRLARLTTPFVEPPLIVGGPDPNLAQIVVVVAPAAAGKTTLSERLAMSTCGVHFDLSRWNVGNNFFPGTLFKAFGPEMAKIMDGVVASTDVVIFDALEETQMRSGEANFEAFLNDLAQTASRGVTGKPSIVLMARAETAEFVSLVMDSAGVAVLTLTIDYFDEDQANSYIDALLDYRSKHDNHRAQRGPFEAARDNLLKTLKAAAHIESGGDRSFLGYAPVLTAVTAYLDVDNYITLTNALTAPAEGPGAAWALVEQILISILIREQEKVCKALAKRFGDDSIDLSQIFDPREQAMRVFKHVNASKTLEVELPQSVPSGRAEEYLEVIAPAVTQHAFVRDANEYANSIFRDCVESLLLANDDANAKALVRASVHVQGRLPSPLLGRFLLGRTKEVSAADVGIIYDSFIASEPRAGSVKLRIVSSSEGRSEVYLSPTPEEPDVVFAVDARSEAISFRRSIRDAAIEINGEIILGSGANDLVLGPNVDITSTFITFDSTAVRAVLTPDPIILAAEAVSLPSSTMSLRMVGTGDLQVEWPDAAYPWVEFFRASGDADPDSSELTESLRHLSHIFKYFVKHKRDNLEAPKLLIQNVAVGRSATAQALFAWLEAGGIVTNSGDYYYVNLEEFTSRGLNYADLRSRTLSDDLKDLLTEFLNSTK